MDKFILDGVNLCSYIELEVLICSLKDGRVRETALYKGEGIDTHF